MLIIKLQRHTIGIKDLRNQESSKYTKTKATKSNKERNDHSNGRLLAFKMVQGHLCHGLPDKPIFHHQESSSYGEAEDVKSLNSTQTSDMDPRAPTFYKAVEPSDISGKTGIAYPYTAHCLASSEIMVSCLRDKDGKAEGNGFLLLYSEFNVKGRWEKPRHNVSDGLYGRHLHVYNWPEGELKQTIDLGLDGLLPIEVYIIKCKGYEEGNSNDDSDAYANAQIGQTNII
ncbi:selenium-binding protein 1-like protein [Tanacetum coccineum]